MNQIATLQNQREEILAELAQLAPMRRGSVTEQMVPVQRADGTRGERGPYPVYTYKEQGETRSRRLHDAAEVAAYRGQIQAFRRFQELTRRLAEIGERLADLDLAAGEVKKTSRAKSNSKKTTR
jgi:hypothetical protein